MATDIEAPLGDGRYRLIDVLGEGGMAIVYRAYDERLQVYRAIKVLSTAYGASSTLQERFLKEARTMARIQHPNIVSVHDMGTDGKRSFMVMEVVEGGSLNDWLARHGPMPPRLALEALRPILAALEAAHEAGVVHRDIKPQNILVSASGRPKVTDFGIARVDQDQPLTRTGSVMGTWGFMAPEQRMNAKQVDGRADLYAVGATLYTLLTGELPVDLFANEIDGAVFEGIDPLVQPLLRKATRYRPEDRYQSAPEMVAAIEELLAALPPLDPDTPPLAGPVQDLKPPPPTPPVAESRETMVPDAAGNATFLPDAGPLALGGVSGELSADDDDEPPPALRRPVWPVAAGALGVLLLGWALWPDPAVKPASATRPTAAPVEAPAEAPAEAPVEPVPDAAPVEEPAPPVEAPVVEAAAPTPARPAVPKPTPPPEPSPPTPVDPSWGVVAPAPPQAARFSVKGDATSVQVEAANGGRYGAGELPAGTYTIVADFGDGVARPAGKLTLAEGERVTLSCNANFAACKPLR